MQRLRGSGSSLLRPLQQPQQQLSLAAPRRQWLQSGPWVRLSCCARAGEAVGWPSARQSRRQPPPPCTCAARRWPRALVRGRACPPGACPSSLAGRRQLVRRCPSRWGRGQCPGGRATALCKRRSHPPGSLLQTSRAAAECPRACHAPSCRVDPAPLASPPATSAAPGTCLRPGHPRTVSLARQRHQRKRYRRWSCRRTGTGPPL
mmetsp:Transcript_5408/g.20591  ORF Transcript_5408/g.20591 Transcript_5408/m.20591 type:complete len:205 (+) Transcript_5408:278-892(+)